MTLVKDDAARHPADRGAARAAALEALADAGGLSSIADPVSWQREQRHELSR
jgi:hypothetical protein